MYKFFVKEANLPTSVERGAGTADSWLLEMGFATPHCSHSARGPYPCDAVRTGCCYVAMPSAGTPLYGIIVQGHRVE